MKRILIALAFIAISFACNAMDRTDEDRFMNFYDACHGGIGCNANPKSVKEHIGDNTYPQQVKPSLLLELALLLQRGRINSITKLAKIEDKSESTIIEGASIENAIGMLSIIAYAHQYCRNVDRYSELIGLEEINSLLEKLGAAPHAVNTFSWKTTLATLTGIGIMNYLTY